jgi:hypothetical protein
MKNLTLQTKNVFEKIVLLLFLFTPLFFISQVSNFPHVTNFESSKDLGTSAGMQVNGWTTYTGIQVTSPSEFSLRRDASGTPSGSTGPSSGANGTNYYVYYESSYPVRAGYNAVMLCQYDLQGKGSAEITFNYHNYGSYPYGPAIAYMFIKDVTSGMWLNGGNSLWGTSKSSNSWLTGTVNLDAYAGRVIELYFDVIAGGTSQGAYRSDFALDEIVVDATNAVTTTPGLWTGATSTLWSVGSNWDDGNVPTSLVNVTIPNTTNKPYVNGNYPCANLTVASGATVHIYAGRSLIVSGTSDINGTLTGAGTFDANGAVDANGGSITMSGTLKLGSTVSSLGNLSTSTGTVEYDGATQTVTADTYYNLVIGGTGTKSLSGNTNWTSLTVNSSPTFNTSTRICSSGAMVVNGTLAITTGTITNSGATDINGRLTISTGLFDANGSFDANGGDVDFTGAGTLRLASTVTSLGTLTSNYGTVRYDGSGSQTIFTDVYNNLSTYGGTQTLAGNVTVNNTLHVESGTLNVNSRTLTLSGLSNIDGNLTVTSGTINASGTSDIDGQVTIGTGTYNADGTFDATSGDVDFTGAGKLILSSTVTSLGGLDNAMGTVEYDGGASTSVLAGSHSSVYNGNTRGYYFKAGSSFTVSGLHVPTDASTGIYQSVQIVDFGTTVPANFGQTGSSFTTLFSSINNSSNATISCNVNIVAGRCYGVIGARQKTSGGSSANSYGNSPTVSYNGVQHTLRRLVYQAYLGNGAGASGSMWSESGNSSISRVTLIIGSDQAVSTNNYYNLEIDTDASNSGTLNIDGDLTINSGASLDKAATSYNIAGSFSNSGTFTTTGGIITFDGSGNVTCDAISNNATDLTINKSSSGKVTTAGNISVDDIKVTLGTLLVDGETVTVDNLAYVNGGTLQITSGLFNCTHTANNIFQLSSGKVDIDGGELRIGTLASTYLPDFYMTGGTLDINAGTLNVSDAIESTSGTITQTGGTINVGAYTGAGTPSSTPKFYKTNGPLNLLAGTLEIKSQYPSAGYNAIQINSGVSILPNKNHLTVLYPSGENMYMDLNGKTLGKMTIKDGGSYIVYARDNFTLLHNLTVNSGASLESMGSSGDITINGKNFKNLGGTFDLNSSTITFSGTSDVTCGAIISNGAGTLGMNKNSNKTLTLTGDVELNNLTLTNGLIIPGTNTLTIRSTSPGSPASHVNGPVTLNASSYTSGSIEVPTGDGTVYRPVFLQPQSSGATTYKVIFYNSAHSSVNWNLSSTAPVGAGVHHVAGGHWWDVHRVGSTKAKVGFNWNVAVNPSQAGDVTAVNEMLVTHWTGTEWENVMGSNNVASGTASSGSVTSDYMDNFSPFGEASSGSGNPLPVDLLSFNATCSHDIVDVDFTILSQINNDYFLVERSEDAVNWEVIGNIDGAGNTNTQMDYNFVDMHPLATQGYYRLTQVDFDAKSETFWPVTTECSTNNTGLDISVYPNPILDHFTIEIDLEEYQGDDVYYTILDIRGSIVKEDQISLTRGFNKHEIQIEDLSTGAYMLRFTNTKNHIKEQRIMVK